MKPSDLTELIALMQEEYPNEEFTEKRIHLWFLALGDLPIPLAVEATLICLGAKPFPPRPGDIRRQVETMLSGLEAHRQLAQLNRAAVWTARDEEMAGFLDRWIHQPRRLGPGLATIGPSGLMELGEGE